jgi:hypothetical protein
MYTGMYICIGVDSNKLFSLMNTLSGSSVQIEYSDDGAHPTSFSFITLLSQSNCFSILLDFDPLGNAQIRFSQIILICSGYI